MPKVQPRKALTAGGWQKPTAPPIRVASQAIMPGLPLAPNQSAEGTKLIFMSSVDKTKE
jgi:hypothetical protein